MTIQRPRLAAFTRRALLGAALGLALAGCGSPAGHAPAPKPELHVMTSGGFTAAYNELRPGFERASGRAVKTAYGASMGNAADSIPSRLARQEPADVVILARPALDALVAQGQVRAGSQVDLVRSSIGFAVRKGAPKPDISSVEALKRTLLAAPSIAYSASASGTYYETELLKKLGLEAQVKPKSRRILSERVGSVVARGDAALGLQQVSELLPIEGIDYLGPLPAEVQQVTVFSAGIATASTQPEAARELIRYLNSPASAPTIAKTGLEPLASR
ncbi:substrate-binding domain-containing protein [Variovorax sp.]|jgi:molybdate transport system substrate-binding protein|uniref:substrate-binding domain-containing protein n=1 Tax=Variovorax sp. TaxID=1871043 RepID=UPI0012131150|nr:substrate-binding domain-containing protein [Variovorax sp.]TAJ59471.1 MAG: ABC transporter substrate-binding protein [Variovorax sp.]